jgi:hypothetical protein
MPVVHGDTSITDAMRRGELEDVPVPPIHDHMLSRPVVAPLGDVGGMGDTSTEDAPSASLLDASATEPRPDPTRRGKTDEEWLMLG